MAFSAKASVISKTEGIETPGNPLLGVADLAALGELCRAHKLLYLVDNTFLTPLLQRPFDFGADVVIHSGTKYLSGHNQIIGGCVLSNDAEHQGGHGVEDRAVPEEEGVPQVALVDRIGEHAFGACGELDGLDGGAVGDPVGGTFVAGDDGDLVNALEHRVWIC